MTDLTKLTNQQLVEYVKLYTQKNAELTAQIEKIENELAPLRNEYDRLKDVLGIEGEYVLKEDTENK